MRILCVCLHKDKYKKNNDREITAKQKLLLESGRKYKEKVSVNACVGKRERERERERESVCERESLSVISRVHFVKKAVVLLNLRENQAKILRKLIRISILNHTYVEYSCKSNN